MLQTNTQALAELTDAEIDAVAGGYNLFGGQLSIDLALTDTRGRRR